MDLALTIVIILKMLVSFVLQVSIYYYVVIVGTYRYTYPCFTDPCPDNPIRLSGSSNTYSGRVEYCYNGIFGTICDDEWSLQDANVACRQLGFVGARRAYGSAYFGPGEGPIWLDNLQCNDSESRLEDCPNKGWQVNDCTHNDDAGVECITGTYVYIFVTPDN